MTEPGAVSIKVPVDLLDTLLMAINCYSDCREGNRAQVEEAWLLDDDQAATGGTYIREAERLQREVAEPVREIERHLIATNPELQDLLHRVRMMRKYGDEGETDV